MTRVRFCSVTASAVAIVLNLGTALAQTSPTDLRDEANDEAMLSRGVELRRDGNDAEALALFERAYAVRHTPRALAQIALAHQALGDWSDAERNLVEALRESEDPWIARARVDLEESLAAIREHLAWLDVESNVSAEVLVGGQVAGRLPLDRPIRIPAGDVVLDIRAAGYPVVRRVLHVEPKSTQHEAVTFVLPAAAEPSGPRSRDVGSRPPASPRRSIGLAALAASGGLGIAGGAGMIAREWEVLIYNSHSCDSLAGQPRSVRCKTNRDLGDAGNTVGLVAFVGAGIAAALSAFLLIGDTTPKAPVSHAATTRSIACEPAGAGIFCHGSF